MILRHCAKDIPYFPQPQIREHLQSTILTRLLSSHDIQGLTNRQKEERERKKDRKRREKERQNRIREGKKDRNRDERVKKDRKRGIERERETERK